jgi:hypothetical protein
MGSVDHFNNAVLAEFTASSKMLELLRGTLDIISPFSGLITSRKSPLKATV